MSRVPVLGPLHQVALGSADLARSVQFYRDRLGLPLIAEFDPPGLVFFQLGETRLLLERTHAPSSGSSVLYFQVPDIHAAHAALKDPGVVFASAPQRIHRDDAGAFGAPGTEEWMAFFADPGGNPLAIAARVGKSG